MDVTAKLITSIAALSSAIAWPIVFIVFVFLFRTGIKSAIARLADLLDRIRNVKLGWVEAKLDALADRASERGQVTTEQTITAAQISSDSLDFGLADVFREMDKLCLQYDGLRRTQPSGHVRTQAMTRIIVKMRALGPAASVRLEAYKTSGSAGSRLAAIAIMQMAPHCGDVAWLLERFRVETPFLFYHAALALTNVANTEPEIKKSEAIRAAWAALDIVKSFTGSPDRETIIVLESLVTN